MNTLYGGTKEEMERLLQTAEQLTGKEYSISSFADIVEAIHEVQSSLYISGLSAEEAATAVAEGLLTEEEAYFKLGTTAKEAEDTIEGSTKAMSALWENLKLSVASGDIEAISENINQLSESAGVFLSNAMPTIESILGGIGIAVKQLAPVIEKKVPELIKNLLPSLVQAATQLISSVAGALPGLVSAITDKETVDTIITALKKMLTAVLDGLGTIVEAAPDIIPDLLEQVGNALVNGVDIIGNAIIKMLPDLENLLVRIVPVIHEVIANLLEVIADLSESLLPDLIEDLIVLVGDLLIGFSDPDTLAKIYDATFRIVTAIFEAFDGLLEPLTDVIVDIFEALFTETMPGLIEDHGDELAESFIRMVGAIFEIVKDLSFIGIAQLGAELGAQLGSAIAEELQPIFGAVVDFFMDIGENIYDGVEAVKTFFSDILQSVTDFFMDVGENIYDWVEERKQKLSEFRAHVIEGIAEFIGDLVGKFGDLKTKLVEKVESITESIGETFRFFVEGAKQWGKDLIDNFVGGITGKIDAVRNGISSITDTIAEYIHFSEPDKGALSNFHTFAPDMIDLFAQGIRDNADKVYDEVAALASGISTDINADVAIERSNGAIAAVGGSTVINVYNTWEGLKIASEIDVDEMSDRAIERMSERLANLEIFSARAYGGVIMP